MASSHNIVSVFIFDFPKCRVYFDYFLFNQLIFTNLPLSYNLNTKIFLLLATKYVLIIDVCTMEICVDYFLQQLPFLFHIFIVYCFFICLKNKIKCYLSTKVWQQ